MKNAPTHFGPVAYEIVSDVDHGRITATIELPGRNPPKTVLLRLRHPKSSPIRSVDVNGRAWTDFDPAKELIRLPGAGGKITLRVGY